MDGHEIPIRELDDLNLLFDTKGYDKDIIIQIDGWKKDKLLESSIIEYYLLGQKKIL